MGEEKAPKGGDGGDKKNDAAGAAAAAPHPIVFKVDLHCAGCASKVKKAIKHCPGVESVVADAAANKVVVTGPADAAALKERIEAKTKKAVVIVSAGSGPKKEAGGGGGGKDKEKKDKEKGKKADHGGEKKKAEKDGGGDKKKADAADKPKEEKKPKEETVTLKIRLHCDGCIDRIKRRIYKIKGVKDVAVDAAKELVKVTGTMDAAALPLYLKDKLNRSVEVVAPGKKDGGGKKDDAKDEKDKGRDKKDAGGEEKKDKDKAGTATAAAMAPQVPDASMYHMPPPPYGYYAYPQVPAGYYPNAGAGPGPNPSGGYYPNAGQYQPYPYHMSHAPQMFSDENPNACSVM